MDYGTDRYLHKKFKKQLNTNIESRTNHAVEPPRINANVPINSTNVKERMLSFVKSSITNNLFYNYEINKKQELDNNRNLFNTQSADISYVKVSVKPTESNTYLTSSIISNNPSNKESTTQDKKLPDSAEESSSPPESSSKIETSVIQDKATSSGGKYVCTYCNLACSKPSVLQKHIRAHTNERPYPCVSCGFSFKTRSNLYKHCRSRTHANRVLGNKAQEISSDAEVSDGQNKPEATLRPQNAEIILNASVIDTTSKNESEPLTERTDIKSKPYKPRFHTTKFTYNNENSENSPTNNTISVSEKQSNSNCDLISLHINELIDKNNTIVNISESPIFRRRSSESSNADTNEQILPLKINDTNSEAPRNNDEPLNLTNKCRKRCLSEVTEPATQKSLIKELLLKNLYADTNMQCPHCKMIFQTVTELELHKMRNCKGITKSGPRYSRSSSVNVASILTQNKNAFDNIPQLQNAVFPLKSPGPFLGKTRLVESDKSKSFSFDDSIQATNLTNDLLKTRYSTPPLTLPYDKVKKPPVKLFGGEVKISQTSGQARSYKIDDTSDTNYNDYTGSLSENRVIKSTLHSGGTVVQKNNQAYIKLETLRTSPDVIRVYENPTLSPTKRFAHENPDQIRFNKENNGIEDNQINIYKAYPNIMDFSQNAANLLAPNLKQLNLAIPKFTETPPKTYTSPFSPKPVPPQFSNFMQIQADFEKLNEPDRKGGFTPKTDTVINTNPLINPNPVINSNPVNLFVNGKVVRYVPGMPGPAFAENEPTSVITIQKKPPNIVITPVETKAAPPKPFEEENITKKLEVLEVKTELPSPKISIQSPNKSTISETPKKFARPNSLALKPSTTSLKQHHGLTPTMFNQILISPDTPRGAKKYNEHFLHGNYFSYLGLKSSTKPVYCTLNKTQPFYVHHFKKLSMYSEWRQQDNKSDKLYISAYDSSQKSHKYTTSGKYTADYIVHSSYKYSASDGISKSEDQKSSSVLGGYESNEEYTYVRGRGRGRYVCDQCGIRCKKPSMLKKHIRTHSNDRPYTCNHCNFSFKTKGNLTKHMKSKAHTKNYAAISSSSSAQQSGTQSSDSDTEDSGMDSSDDSCSTRQQEHEAAYGLLSLSQKSSSGTINVNPSEVNSVVSSSVVKSSEVSFTTSSSFINAEQLVQVSKTNYAKNKILDEQRGVQFNHLKLNSSVNSGNDLIEEPNNRLNQYLGIGNTNQSLTYPYQTINVTDQSDEEVVENEVPIVKSQESEKGVERKNIIHFNVIKKYSSPASTSSSKVSGDILKDKIVYNNNSHEKIFPVVSSKDDNSRKRKTNQGDSVINKVKKSDSEVMDLSMSQAIENNVESEANRIYYNPKNEEQIKPKNSYNEVKYPNNYNKNEYVEQIESENNRININYIIQESHINNTDIKSNNKPEYDNSAMETLADIATKQEKLEKNSVAKNVATEFLKLATKNEFPKGEEKGFINNNKDMHDLVGKSEENKSCHICSKSFNKPSQLKLHMNIHYLERPFRCESCSVSFRTKGHLQKHERSASHHNKLSSSPALSSSEPRPFKCIDCNIAFRIHGHLAKHLRSKMHIMKLECLAKIPFGLYAELERSNSLLTEINTADGDQCLDSLKTLAKKVFVNDPNKLIHVEDRSLDKTDVDTDS